MQKIKEYWEWLLLLAVLFLIVVGFVVYGTKDGKPPLALDTTPTLKETTPVTKPTWTTAPVMEIDKTKTYYATLLTTEGSIKLELFAKDAPLTVNNFVFLANQKFYDGITFHRVIKDFMIQGGDPLGNGTGGPGYKFKDEINRHKIVAGTLAMANSGPDTNGSQFFIVTKQPQPHLDGKHTVFGKVVEGMENVNKIAAVSIDGNDKPITPVLINKVLIEKK